MEHFQSQNFSRFKLSKKFFYSFFGNFVRFGAYDTPKKIWWMCEDQVFFSFSRIRILAEWWIIGMSRRKRIYRRECPAENEIMDDFEKCVRQNLCLLHFPKNLFLVIRTKSRETSEKRIKNVFDTLSGQLWV